MPCNTISTMTVDAGKLDLDLATAALREMGLNPRRAGQTVFHDAGTYDAQSGIATWRRLDRTTELKKEYGLATVKAQAIRHGWTIRPHATDRYQLEILKR